MRQLNPPLCFSRLIFTYVLNSSNDTGSKDKLFPGLTNVDQVDTYKLQFSYPITFQIRKSKFFTISTTLVDIRSHTGVGVLGTNVTLGTQKELDILFGGVENGRNTRHIYKKNSVSIYCLFVCFTIAIFVACGWMDGYILDVQGKRRLNLTVPLTTILHCPHPNLADSKLPPSV